MFVLFPRCRTSKGIFNSSYSKIKDHLYVEIKCQLDATADFYSISYCLLNKFRALLCPSSGALEYYTGGCCLWYLVLWSSSCRYGLQLRVMCPVCGLLPANRTHTLELLMMGIVVPETCWASNKIWNKSQLLHLAGILFPHINDDAWSKSHQIQRSLVSKCELIYHLGDAWPQEIFFQKCNELHPLNFRVFLKGSRNSDCCPVLKYSCMCDFGSRDFCEATSVNWIATNTNTAPSFWIKLFHLTLQSNQPAQKFKIIRNINIINEKISYMCSGPDYLVGLTNSPSNIIF
jgi:hypothetical protein